MAFLPVAGGSVGSAAPTTGQSCEKAEIATKDRKEHKDERIFSLRSLRSFVAISAFGFRILHTFSGITEAALFMVAGAIFRPDQPKLPWGLLARQWS